MTSAVISELVELADLAAGVDAAPRDVAQRAVEIHRLASAHGGTEVAAVAATVLARARRNLGEIELAERAIADAIELAASVGGDVLADAHQIAASIASFNHGPTQTSFHLAEAERHGSAPIRAEVRIQRAVIAKREGRLDEALALYEEAIPTLRASGDRVMLARVLSNRGSLNVLSGRPSRALLDFDESKALFEATGQHFAVALVIENIAWALSTMGDIPAALGLLDEASDLAARHDHHLQDAAVSKALALMAAGLFLDAIDVLAQVVRTLAAEGDRAGVGEALLFQAEAARLAGLPSGRALAEQARAIFVGLGATGWERHAHLEVLQASALGSSCLTDDNTLIDDIEQLARRLAGSGQARIEVEAWNLAVSVALSRGELARAERAAARCANRAASIPFVEHRLAAAHAVASVQAAAGQTQPALSTITEILAEFDRYRRAIGSPDARSASGLHAGALLSLGSDLVAGSGDAERILAWSEHRRRSVHVWDAMLDRADGAPIGSQDDSRDGSSDDSANELMAELRSVLAELRQAETAGAASGRDPSDLARRRAELEDELRDRLLRTGGPSVASSDEWSFDPTALGGHVGVSLDRHGDRLLAVVIEGGSVRCVEIGSYDEAASACRAAARLLSAAVRTGAAGAAGSSIDGRLRSTIDRLDRLVVDRLELADGPVVLAMPAELQDAPWAATDGLIQRATTLTPSLRWWSERDPNRPCITGGAAGRVSSIAGPRLDCATAEARAVAACHRDVDLLVGDDANIDAVIEAFASSAIVHVAAHSRVRHDNPMWSTIELADGPLVLHQLARHGVSAPLVILSTCESAMTAGARGAPLPGFAAALLDLGAHAVVAATSLLPDDPSTCVTIEALHRSLAGGRGPSDSLATVRADHPDRLAAIALTTWGRG